MLRHSADLNEPKIAFAGCLNRTPARRSKKRGTKLSPAERYDALRTAEMRLKQALIFAKDADAPMLAGKIRAAIKSCGGAIRHAENAEARAYRQAREIEELASREFVVVEGRKSC